MRSSLGPLPVDVEWRPTRWELLLREVGLTEEQALELLRTREEMLEAAPLGMARRLRQWIRQHYTHAFVPEGLLDALGLRMNEDALRFGAGDGVRAEAAREAYYRRQRSAGLGE